jgi:ABC-type dipeptide/oligopeptide/nickel transport system permease subunit
MITVLMCVFAAIFLAVAIAILVGVIAAYCDTEDATWND